MLRRTTNREYLTDHAFFADIMAVCALSSARVRDGALFPGRWEPEYFQTPPSELFFAAAKDSIPQDLSAMQGLDWLRTCGLLALYGIQVGKINVMHQYLGLYHSLIDMDGLHDEKNWPKGIGIVETELRRRHVRSLHFPMIRLLTVIVLVYVCPRSILFRSMGTHGSLSRIAMSSQLPHRG